MNNQYFFSYSPSKSTNSLLFFLISFFLISSITFANEGIDVPLLEGDQYRLTYEMITNQSEDIDSEVLKPYKVLLVAGMWTKSYPRMADFLRYVGFKIPMERLISFAHQQQWFIDHDIEVEMSSIDTSKDCDFNAERLALAILTSPKKVILLTHSKGGLDILHALINYPQIRSKIKGWISLQTPFEGTPLVEWLKNHTWLGGIPRSAIYWLFGSTGETLECVHPQFRKEYYDKHKEEIFASINDFNFISFSSSKSPASIWEKKGIFDPFISWMSQTPFELSSDGIVPTSSGCLPDKECIILDKMDHAAPVMDIPNFESLGKENRILFTRTLLKILMNEEHF